MVPHLTIQSRDEIPAAIRHLQLVGAPQVPLYQALYRGEIGFVPIHRNTSARYFKQWAAVCRLPAIATIGDDNHATNDGPQAWRLASRAIGWAGLVIVHGASGSPSHYSVALDAAHVYRRVLIIECASARLDAWNAVVDRHAAPNASRLVIRPQAGAAHPCPPGPGAVH